ncbi:hemerythrin domain-containing protein [Aerolutibacter ruishenii]|uniref:Hemerythrin-like domain-containing protein n=1 Tax=Aerolutibacter ruishenii TaxID=686800 RepID=A0A562LRS0_9GAMM|nr:hemerythrin domain-containing protein [Lysobacter ruishenii]TWI10306.1 hypothetical protein IP93_01884 [Lysobacter ruishenii]
MPRLGPFLQLSRDHHNALVLARSVAGMPSSAPVDVLQAMNLRIAQYWQTEMRAHFQQEEAILAQYPDALPRVLQQRLLDDHLVLAEGARRAEALSLDEPALRAWGERLATHVRMEERECFPVMQAALGLG